MTNNLCMRSALILAGLFLSLGGCGAKKDKEVVYKEKAPTPQTGETPPGGFGPGSENPFPGSNGSRPLQVTILDKTRLGQTVNADGTLLVRFNVAAANPDNLDLFCEVGDAATINQVSPSSQCSGRSSHTVTLDTSGAQQAFKVVAVDRASNEQASDSVTINVGGSGSNDPSQPAVRIANMNDLRQANGPVTLEIQVPGQTAGTLYGFAGQSQTPIGQWPITNQMARAEIDTRQIAGQQMRLVAYGPNYQPIASLAPATFCVGGPCAGQNPTPGYPSQGQRDALMVGNNFRIQVPTGMNVLSFSSNTGLGGSYEIQHVTVLNDPLFPTRGCPQNMVRTLNFDGFPKPYCMMTYATPEDFKADTRFVKAMNHVEFATDWQAILQGGYERFTYNAFSYDPTYDRSAEQMYGNSLLAQHCRGMPIQQQAIRQTQLNYLQPIVYKYCTVEKNVMLETGYRVEPFRIGSFFYRVQGSGATRTETVGLEMLHIAQGNSGNYTDWNYLGQIETKLYETLRTSGYLQFLTRGGR